MMVTANEILKLLNIYVKLYYLSTYTYKRIYIIIYIYLYISIKEM